MARSLRILTFSLAVVVSTMLVGAIVPASAAKSKAKVSPSRSLSAMGLSRLYIPSSMIAGSLVTKGRVFYRSTQPETTLGGIRLGRSANTILSMWGNPTRITLGTTQAEVASIPQPSTAGPAYIPPGGGLSSAYSSYMQGVNRAASILGMQTQPLPGLPGLEAPGMVPPSPQPGVTPQGPTSGGETQLLSQEEVTWTYDLQNGITLEYIITNGIITQITVGGEGPWSLSKTRTGLQLGDSYKLVLAVCGFPEEPQRYVGRFLRVSYVEKNRVLFTFLNKRVVGITIAMVPQEIQNK
jgi:hypothetical protein